MSPKTAGKLSLVVLDRASVASQLESIAQEKAWGVDVLGRTSALDVIGEGGAGAAGALVISVGAAGPFLEDLLRWTEARSDRRIPTLVIGSGSEGDDAASRKIVGRDHVRWLDALPNAQQLADWLVIAFEVHLLRAFRSEHDGLASALREARMQIFHGYVSGYSPPDMPPCGPVLPTTIDEIQALRDARAQFERAHIQAVVRESGSLKDAAVALEISYTSLWRRLR